MARYGKKDVGRWVEDTGFVKRLLSDDSDGDRHQRFIVQLREGGTLLVVHNLDIAERVPLGVGDRVSFRGLYEYNELGGLVHWTHHDPHGVEDDGWIRYRRQLYK